MIVVALPTVNAETLDPRTGPTVCVTFPTGLEASVAYGRGQVMVWVALVSLVVKLKGHVITGATFYHVVRVKKEQA